jgi:hypothetical protein
MGAGQLRLGGVESFTVTVKLQLAGLPATSLTEQFTVVVPAAKVEPLAGVQITVPTPEQLSFAIGVV